MVTLYNVISSDGYIASKDGKEDFIPNELWNIFSAKCKKFRTLIVGRKTYEAIQTYDTELLEVFENLPIHKIVVSGDKHFCPKEGYVKVATPEAAVALDQEALVASGPTLNNYLIKNSLVKEIILYEIPVFLNDGIRAFEEIDHILNMAESDICLHGIKVRKYKLDSA